MLTPDEVNANRDLQELVLDADRRYAELLNQVRLKLPKQIAARRYQAGDEMRVLASKLGVDAIGFADLVMIASAPGALFLSGSGTQQMLTVSVIDGGTATIEAYFVPPALRRGALTGYEAVMADPAGKIGEMAAAHAARSAARVGHGTREARERQGRRVRRRVAAEEVAAPLPG